MCNVRMIRTEPGLVSIPLEKAVYCENCTMVSSSALIQSSFGAATHPSIGGVAAYATLCSYRERQTEGKGQRQLQECDESSAPCVSCLCGERAEAIYNS